MRVSRFRPDGVVGLPNITEPPRRRVDNAACGLSTSRAYGGQRCAVTHPTVQSVIVPTLCVGTQPQTLRVCGTQSVNRGPTMSGGILM